MCHLMHAAWSTGFGAGCYLLFMSQCWVGVSPRDVCSEYSGDGSPYVDSLGSPCRSCRQDSAQKVTVHSVVNDGQASSLISRKHAVSTLGYHGCAKVRPRLFLCGNGRNFPDRSNGPTSASPFGRNIIQDIFPSILLEILFPTLP
jgi:hypothetical protein